MIFIKQFFYKAFVAGVFMASVLIVVTNVRAQAVSSVDPGVTGGSPSITPTPTPMPKPRTTWGGVYFGGFGGSNFSTASANTSTVFDPNGYFFPTSVPAVNTTGTQSLKGNNVTGGIEIGYNRQRSSFVYGAEFDFGILSGTKSASGTTVYPCCGPTTLTVSQSLKSSWLTSLRPRAGFAYGKRILVYATGGAALTKYDYEAVFTDTHNAATESGSIIKKRIGWIGGGGVEYMIRNRISVKGEFLHTEFGRVSTTSTNLNINIPPGNVTVNPFTHSVFIKGNLVRFGINFHF
jgi:outer membrane immunogenic protein